MAFANPNITAFAVEATEFPISRGNISVNGVPKTVVNDEVEILGRAAAGRIRPASPSSQVSSLKSQRSPA
jgi:hypothetical protein